MKKTYQKLEEKMGNDYFYDKTFSVCEELYELTTNHTKPYGYNYENALNQIDSKIRKSLGLDNVFSCTFFQNDNGTEIAEMIYGPIVDTINEITATIYYHKRRCISRTKNSSF